MNIQNIPENFYFICFDDDSNNPLRETILYLILKLNNLHLKKEEFTELYNKYKKDIKII